MLICPIAPPTGTPIAMIFAHLVQVGRQVGKQTGKHSAKGDSYEEGELQRQM